MRNQDRRSPKETQGQLLRPVTECSTILDAIAVMCTRLGRPMSPERQDQLLKDLEPYRLEAIDWALDNWGRNSRTLPVIGELTPLLRTWVVDNVRAENCAPECQERHGRGYGTNDILWLIKKRMASSQPWTEGMYDAALTDLDRRREGGAPEWRR